jgi:hypothetical protein
VTELSLGGFVATVCRELADAVERSAGPGTAPGQAERMRVVDVDLDVPARIRLSAAAGAERLLVALPSAREQPHAGRIGRLRLTIAHTGGDTPPPGSEEPDA